MAWYDIVGNIGSALIARNAARDASAAQLAAGQQAAAAAEFKPYSITTGFGTSYFDKDKQQAGYEMDPALKAFQDTFYQGAGGFLGQVTTDPMEAARRYQEQQMGLLSPYRAAEDEALRAQQLQTGRIGLGLSGVSQGAGAGTGYVNPEQYSRDLAREQENQRLAMSSYELGQADIDRAMNRGMGLMQGGLGVEQLGLMPLTIGADIGSKQATSGAQQGANLVAGASAATQANLAGSLGAAGMLSNMFKTGSGYKFDPQTGKPIA